jgi:hypothetical protein
MAVTPSMPRRKVTPQKQPAERLRFTSAEIVRAIEDVQAAGLTVHAVEISLAGSIKITTQPEPSVSRRPQKTRTVRADPAEETTPIKKQA